MSVPPDDFFLSNGFGETEDPGEAAFGQFSQFINNESDAIENETDAIADETEDMDISAGSASTAVIAAESDETNAMDISGGSSSNARISTGSPPAGRRRRGGNVPIPTDAEIIDLDSFLPEPLNSAQNPIDLMQEPIINSENKSEDVAKVVVIKSESVEKGWVKAKGYIKWPNSADDPIILDDDEDYPPPPPPAALKPRRSTKEGGKTSPPPNLEDVPMVDQPAQDATAPSETFEDTPSTPVADLPIEDAASPDKNTSGVQFDDEIDIKAATSPIDIPTVNENPASSDIESATGSINARLSNRLPASPNATTGGLGLGTSTLNPKGPAPKERMLTSAMRARLGRFKQRAFAGKRDLPTSNGGASSAARGPTLPSAHPGATASNTGPSSGTRGTGAASAQPAPITSSSTSANSSAPRALASPPVPAAPVPVAGPSNLSISSLAQPVEDEVSFEDIVNDHAMMDAGLGNPHEDQVPDEYLDAAQKFKEEKAAFEKRQAAGKTTTEDEIKLMQRQTEMDMWKKRLREDAQYDNPPASDSLFVPDDTDPMQALASYANGTNDHNDFGGSEQLLEFELQAEPSNRSKGASGKKDKKDKKDKKAKGKPGRPKGSANDNNKVKDRNARVSKKAPAKGKKDGPSTYRKQGPSMLDIGSLYTGNVFRDAEGNADRPQLAKMSHTRRQDALKSLVASVPQEHRKTAQVDRNYLDSACKDFVGRLSVRSHVGSDGWEVTGMTCILKHHQLLGAAFMRRRERGNTAPFGGICADQMGLGKTIMMLANIVNGRPPHNYEGSKTTLIVATPALITQWMSEINKHTLQEKKYNWRPLKVLKWHGKSKPCTNDPNGGIYDFDVVLTTFDEVRKSYPKQDFPIHLQTRHERETWWREFYEENKGPLHDVEFLRVVLDEAQAIKNYKSHTSMACRGLRATHRWALSGTPIQNAPKELFPYFKFLHVEHTGTYKIFCQNFIGTHSDGSLSAVGLDRLHSFLSRFMIRRTHADQLMGAPIVILPKASERIYWCHFNELERSIYEMVRVRMIQRINRLSRTRQLESNYSNVLTMLLRLRQLTGHLLALEQPMKDLLEKEDHEKIYELALEASTNHRMTHKQQMRRTRESLFRPNGDHDKTGIPGVNVDDEDTGNGNDNDNDRADSVHGSPSRKDCSDTGRHHGSKFDFLMYLQDLKDGIAGRNSDMRTACNFCNDIAEDAWMTQCYHVYCKRCLERMAEEAAVRDLGGARCVACQTIFTSTKACDQMDFNQHNDNDNDDSGGDDSDQELLRKTKKQGRRGKKAKGEKKKDWIDLAPGNDILPSSKTLAIKAQIINWIQENPDVKIIIYTQFIDMIRILSKVCNAEKWHFALYHGGKSHEARDEAIKEFSENPDMRIMLASLRCGGVGLNLTMAQKVIVVDPWWNSSVEQQAFCRVFRIGQESETSMTRFVVEKTVDENMIRMQERKQKEIDDVIDGGKHRKLSIPDLLRLFGETEEGADGNTFILVENRETLPNPNGDPEDEEFDED